MTAADGDKKIDAGGFVIALIVFVCIAVAGWAIARGDPFGRTGPALPAEFEYRHDDLNRDSKAIPVLYREVKIIPVEIDAPASVACAADDVFYVATGNKVYRFDGDSLPKVFNIPLRVYCIAISVGGKELVVGGKDNVLLYSVAKNGLALIRTWRIENQKVFLTSLVLSDNFVYVADSGNRVIYKYDRQGKLHSEIGRADKEKGVPGFVIPSPHFDIDVAGDGMLRAVNPGAHRIEAYSSAGRLEMHFGEYSGTSADGFTGCCNPVSFVMTPDDGYVTCEKGIPRVKLYDFSGKFAGMVAGPDSFDPKVDSLDVAVSPSGVVYILDPVRKQVRVFVKKGGVDVQ